MWCSLGTSVVCAIRFVVLDLPSSLVEYKCSVRLELDVAAGKNVRPRLKYSFEPVV